MEDEEMPIYAPPGDEETGSSVDSYNTEIFYGLPEDEASDQSEVEGLRIEANAGDEGTRKRARIDDMLNPEPDDIPVADTGRTTRPMKSKTVGKKRHVEPIIGLVGQGMPDIRKIWQSQNIVLPALHLFQLSPLFRSETARLMRVQRKTRKKKGAEPTVSSGPTGSTNSGPSAGVPNVPTNSVQIQGASTHHAESESLAAMSRGPHRRAFGIDAVVWGSKSKSKFQISREHVVADQGSDINIIYPDLVNKLGLKRRNTSELGQGPLSMTVANGAAQQLHHYVKVYVRVGSILRYVWAFVSPHNYHRLALLLGRPWLNSVDAEIYVRQSKIVIGDKAKGEKVEVIQGPRYMEHQSLKHLLVPVNNDNSSSSEDSSDSDGSSTSSGSESEEEDDDKPLRGFR
jgi:hypothetical protein